jgi:hypothetical protein
VDVAFCYANNTGVDSDQAGRIRWDIADQRCETLAGEPVSGMGLTRESAEEILDSFGDTQIHGGNHFHIRFAQP